MQPSLPQADSHSRVSGQAARRPRQVLSISRANLSVWTLAVRALWRHRAMAFAQCMAMALALAVPLSLSLVGDGAAQAGYQSLLGAGRGSSAVIIEQPGIANPASFADFQQRTAVLVDGQLGDDLELLTTYTRAGSFRINTLNGKSSPGDANLTAAYYPDLLSHVALVNGIWPDGNGLQSPIPFALSQSGAAEAGLTLGDIACVGTLSTLANRSWCVRLVGTWRPLKPSDPYWQGGPSNTDVTLSAADYYQFLAAANSAAGDVVFRAGRVYQPNPARFKVAGAPGLVNGLTQLRGQVEIRDRGTFSESLDHTIQTFLDRTHVDQFPIQLVGVSLLLVVVYALALLSQNYLDAQHQQSLLWRTRGWRRERMAGFLLLQLGILLVPAILLAVALALAATWLLLSNETGTSAPVNVDSAGVLIPALAVGIALVLIVEAGLTVRFCRRSVLEMRRALARPSSVAWWRWRNLDLGLALLAIPLLGEAQLRSQAAVRSASSGQDFIGLALPVAAIAVLGLAALRLLPLFARASRLAPHNLAARLSWLRISRRPAEHAGLALLMALAVAIGVFAGVYSATEHQNIVDRVAYNVGADVLVRYDDHALPAAMGNDLAKIEHVTTSTRVLRQTLYLGGTSEAITALGVDTPTFLATAWTRDGLSTPALDQSLARLAKPEADGTIPILMSQATMSRLGIKTGFEIYLYIGSRGTKATVVGALDYIPTLYPGTDDFMVMALDQALALASGNQSFSVAPNELWLKVNGDHRAAVATLLRDSNVAFVQDRGAEQASALSDPLFVELQANLAIGFVTALALAALAFAVHFLTATRRRLSEHAILEANGLEPSVVRAGIAIEQGIVVAFALAVGCALAATLIVWLLPTLQLGSAASDLIPPTILHADWLALGIGALVTLGVAGALAWAIRRAGTAVDTVEELRRLG
jgi:predicted lysophospholipase L1 biosynthesis ABC-type transport system permease subunit